MTSHTSYLQKTRFGSPDSSETWTYTIS